MAPLLDGSLLSAGKTITIYIRMTPTTYNMRYILSVPYLYDNTWRWGNALLGIDSAASKYESTFQKETNKPFRCGRNLSYNAAKY
jgi:hypothetical protein